MGQISLGDLGQNYSGGNKADGIDGSARGAVTAAQPMGWPGAASCGNNWQTPPKHKRPRRDKNLGFNGSSFKLMSAPCPVSWIGEGNGSPLPPIRVSKSLRSRAKKPEIAKVAESCGRAGNQIGTGCRETLASIPASWRTGPAASPRSVGFLARNGPLTGLHYENQSGKKSLWGRRAKPSWSSLAVRS